MSTGDPRRRFSVAPAARCKDRQVIQQQDQGARKSFLDNILKIGEIEGTGEVGEGLRALASVSNSIRVGQDGSPSTLLGQIASIPLEAINQGGEAVLGATGLSDAANRVLDFNPGVVNRAVGQSQAIFQRVKQGNFELSDIPGTFQDLQNLEQLARGIFNSADEPPKRDPFCEASPYAIDLIALAPKFNFMFVMDIQFDPSYRELTRIGDTMAFAIQTTTRPNIEFEYEEVNMYNFRTRIPKRTVYQPMRMTFLDDNENAAHLFYTSYVKAMSPIANQAAGSANFEYDLGSMDYDNDSALFQTSEGTVNFNNYGASLGALEDNKNSIIRRIRLFHVFDYGNMMNIYNFFNPRILNFNPSELTMTETGEGGRFEFEFAYDGLFMEPGWSVAEGAADINVTSLTNRSDTARYPVDPLTTKERAEVGSQLRLAPSVQKQPTTDPADVGFAE